MEEETRTMGSWHKDDIVIEGLEGHRSQGNSQQEENQQKEDQQEE